MSSFVLRSSNSDASVECGALNGDYFSVTVRAHDHFASRQVYAYTDAPGIGRVFADAAKDWKGWVGAKTWESIEGEFRLELTTDRLGHVTLALRLQSDPGGADFWELKADLGLEAGQLEGISREAASHFGDAA